MKLKVIGVIASLLFALASCQNEEELEFSRYYSTGKVIYQYKCQNCHGDNGEGLRGLIPPLTNAAYLKANKAKLACMIRNGVKGRIQVGNQSFDNEMEADDMPAIEIAEVLTYVTNSFGHKMGTITSQQVGEDLKKCK